ncbi:hypothetical protein GO984_10505 [Rhodobacteraceae bacterium CY05]|uniref:Lipoprotein n=2 Tax=Parasedimentitalea huanghaiensis TaxID=2682100 RepID=A0A6L6WFL0_9RHOB|nr:hypothetical protein [Zongyanglinia huanghaiensis]
MKSFLSLVAVFAFSFSGCSSEASNFKRTTLGARVYPLEGGVFEVVPQSGGGGPDYWCAASDYARRHLGAGWQMPIYVYRSMAPGEVADRRSTVLFTLNPVASAAPQSQFWRVSAFNVGDSMTVQQGDNQCNVFPRWY